MGTNEDKGQGGEGSGVRGMGFGVGSPATNNFLFLSSISLFLASDLVSAALQSMFDPFIVCLMARIFSISTLDLTVRNPKPLGFFVFGSVTTTASVIAPKLLK